MLIVLFLVLFLGANPNTQASDRAKKLYGLCTNCHQSVDPKQYSTATSLENIIGRDIASVKGFDYSERLLAQEGIWTKEKLDAFLTRPNHAQPGTKMFFRGLRNKENRTILISWLAGEPYEAQDNKPVTIGGDIFKRCKICHSYQAGAPAKIGPNLYGVYGRKIASFPNFDYSEQLLRWDGVWDKNTLNAFFMEFKGFRQGSHAAFNSLVRESDRTALIEHLKSLSPQSR